MDKRGRRRAEGGTSDTARAADWDAADEVRLRLREQGIIPIEPDERIATVLGPDEAVLAFRPSVAIDRRHPSRGNDAGLPGDFYVTTRRIVHLGRVMLDYELDDITEAAVAGDELLLIIGTDRGLSLAVEDPRVLRVEIAAARAARRAR
jgi:hypothetical protein